MEGITFDAPERPTVEGPLIFLAGPIQGAPLWQTEAISMIRTYSTTVHIASPRRRKLERLIKPTASFAARFTESFVGEMYIEQVDWETRYLNRAAENGCILFWLAKEENHICTRAYAQTSRFELAEWKKGADGIRISRWLSASSMASAVSTTCDIASAKIFQKCQSSTTSGKPARPQFNLPANSGSRLRQTSGGYPLYAFSNSAISNFFIFKNACVTRAICSGVPCPIILFIAVGTICHDSPNLSFNQPHCSAFGSAESLPQ